MNRLAPLTCCLLVAALCAAILGLSAAAFVIVGACAVFEFLLPGYAPPAKPPNDDVIEESI